MEWSQLLNPERPRPSSVKGGDGRLQFERDYDRAIFSTPVKRLQDKAQVHPLDSNDGVRTRLTHSLEVSCVARGIATNVENWLLENGHINQSQLRIIPTIASTCGIIHDLGNPPFGHAGELSIKNWFVEKFRDKKTVRLMGMEQPLMEDFTKFDGNAQTLRLLTKLQVLADFKGLNLTFGTLSALGKYTASSEEVGKTKDCAKEKLGYFHTEKTDIDEIRNRTGTGDARNPLAFIVEAADDIAYSAADLEDGIRKGILTWKEAQTDLEGRKGCDFSSIFENVENILKNGSKCFPGGMPDEVYASAFRTAVISNLVKATADAFAENYDSLMSGSCRASLISLSKGALIVDALKDLARKKVYCIKSTLKLELLGNRVITDLLDLFWDGVMEYPESGSPKKTIKFEQKVAALLSSNYCHVFQNAIAHSRDMPVIYHRMRLLTDYVCGMTDTFAMHLHGEFTSGS